MIIKIGTLGTMKAEFDSLEVRQHHLVANMEVREGIPYAIVSALSYRELWNIARAAFSPGILWYVVSGWLRSKGAKPPKL